MGERPGSGRTTHGGSVLDLVLRLIGALLVLGGFALVLLTAIDVAKRVLDGVGVPPQELTGVVLRVMAGVWGLTTGQYVYRAAGRRGWRDRLGRVLIVTGYTVLLGGAAHVVREVSTLLTTLPEQGAEMSSVTNLLITALLVLALTSALVVPGMRLAGERAVLAVPGVEND
ncbi:MAG TPA: hypothetical protein VIL00_13450 [Pseudonocardiaceae bacterium]